MKNNIKKAPVKFWEDLLYFQHFMQIYVLCSKLVIITTLNPKQPTNLWPGGWSGGAMVLGKRPVPGRPTSLEGVVGWCEGAG